MQGIWGCPPQTPGRVGDPSPSRKLLTAIFRREDAERKNTAEVFRSGRGMACTDRRTRCLLYKLIRLMQIAEEIFPRLVVDSGAVMEGDVPVNTLVGREHLLLAEPFGSEKLIDGTCRPAGKKFPFGVGIGILRRRSHRQRTGGDQRKKFVLIYGKELFLENKIGP